MKRYYLHRRRGIYYAELTKNGVKLSARSTGTKNRDEAVEKVLEWLKNGLPTRTGGEQGFIDFLLEFWNPARSLFLKDKAAHGDPVTKRYCQEATRIIKQNWQPYFGKIPLSDVTKTKLREFGLSLSDQGLSGGTINNRMVAGCQPLRWAFQEKLLRENITEGLNPYKRNERKRDIFTHEEIESLFSVPWDNNRAYVAALTALTSGLRIGEILGLRRKSIGDDILHITNNWNPVDGEKLPKNGETREAPLYPEVKTLLNGLLAESPWAGMDNPFVFYNLTSSDRPYRDSNIRDGLFRAMKMAGISREGRKLDYHSLRHTFSTMTAKKVSLEKIALILGHKTLSQTSRYSGHVLESDIKEITDAGKEIFGKILQFKKGA